MKPNSGPAILSVYIGKIVLDCGKLKQHGGQLRLALETAAGQRADVSRLYSHSEEPGVFHLRERFMAVRQRFSDIVNIVLLNERDDRLATDLIINSRMFSSEGHSQDNKDEPRIYHNIEAVGIIGSQVCYCNTV
jgi:hypothetical protein